MIYYRKRYITSGTFGRRFATLVKIELSEDEKFFVERAGLWNARIRNSESILTNPKGYLEQIRGLRNRWDIGISRTTGFVFLDIIGTFFSKIFAVIVQIPRIFFGTRVKLKDLIEGAEFASKNIEDQRKSETHIFTSLVAITKAYDFARNGSAEAHMGLDEVLGEVPGLGSGLVLVSKPEHDGCGQCDG